MKRRFNKFQRLLLAMRSGGTCEQCGTQLTTRNYHADHVIPWSKSGPTTTRNGSAKCAECNLKKGNKMAKIDRSKLRRWQDDAITKALTRYNNDKKEFLVNAAPGAGKTRMAISLATEMIERDMIDRVIVIAPRKKIAKQWRIEFKKISGRAMTQITRKGVRGMSPEKMNKDMVMTWQSVGDMAPFLQDICRHHRVLVVADEVHHAAIEAAWGRGTTHALDDAKYALALTGTPVRSDGENPVFMFDLAGIELPDDAKYEVSYRMAIEEGWCVPVAFLKERGHLDVSLGSSIIRSHSDGRLDIPPSVADDVTDAIRNRCHFGRLIKQPLGTVDQPHRQSNHSEMIIKANQAVMELRNRPYGKFGLPNAGCLVITQNIQAATYFKKLIELLYPQDEVEIVHSDMANPTDVIEDFEHGTGKWIVSVNMISEGVDIPRLRVLVYLPHGDTELVFRQAIGRVIRKSDSNGDPKDDNSRAVVILPEVNMLPDKKDYFAFARRIEDEMPAFEEPEGPIDPPPPPPPPAVWTCSDWSDQGCGTINPGNLQYCHSCNLPRHQPVSLNSGAGYRDGGISRGFDISEDEVTWADNHGEDIQDEISASGDPRIKRIGALFPKETYGLLHEFFGRKR